MLLSLLSVSSWAESVISLNMQFPNTAVKSIVSAEFIEFDLIRLDMPVAQSNDLHFELICSFNPFYDYDRSYIFLTHSTIYRAQKFELKDQDCLELFNFMKKRFEYISEESPIEIELDYKLNKVKSVRWKTIIYAPENDLDLS